MKNKVIPIFFATDDNYAPYLSVAICSLLENASKDYFYKIHIITNSLSAKNKSILKTFGNKNCEIKFVDISSKINKLQQQLFLRDYYSLAIYYRLFLAEMFDEFDKAIYLDCDIVVKGDISKLYEIPLSCNQLIGAVNDEAVVCTDEFVCYSENFLGIEKEKYFNSGVLLMNFKALRDFQFEKKFLKLLEQVKFTVAPDQDFLNVLCYDRVKFIDKVWNKMTILGDRDVSEINLIHYNLSLKPWHYKDVRYCDYFWQYAKKTSFYNHIQNEFNSYSVTSKENDVLISNRLKALAFSYAIKGGEKKKIALKNV